VGKIKISLTIEEETYMRFKEFCAKNGMKVSPKVEVLMKEASKDTTLRQYLQ